MAEVTKTVVDEGVMGDQRYIVYELTNPSNGETVTTPFNKVIICPGHNETTADKVWNCSLSIVNGKGVVTTLINTTTDEYRIMCIGK